MTANEADACSDAAGGGYELCVADGGVADSDLSCDAY